MKRKLLPPLFLLLVGTFGASTQQVPFSLAVVPTVSSNSGSSITMSHNKAREFYVVLTNISKEPQSVWESWNSWGYQAIYFEVATPEGHKVVISKASEDFTRNFPSSFVIQPGEHCVYAIRLDESWGIHPGLRKADEMPIKLKAIYEVALTPEATKYKVWTGRLESHSYNFTLRQW
jgi:hypothetical protein